NNIVARFEYDAWGNILSEEVSIPALARCRYRFQGREWSAAMGLYNFRMRWYDAETGRWLSKDPIGLNGGLNLYAFCGNDVVNSVDPEGEDIHYTSEKGGHSVLWVDKPESPKKVIFFEFGPKSGNVLWGDSIITTGEEDGHHGETTIKTTAEEDKKAIKKIRKIQEGNPRYSLPFRNCAHEARKVIRAAKKDLPNRIIDSPTILLNDIRGLK
ncbi:MAG: RHS repeat-associated core domain-containing protein, partial [Victivallales bacterium]|nr:RHS repeat-associated core domain-containing protein [Victivallales bacterium]